MVEVRAMNKIRDLNGVSGCQVGLYRNADQMFVRKISSSIEYNPRMRKQCEKQIMFSNNCILTPKVYERGYLPNGLYYFDMEYIQGQTLASYLPHIESSRVQALAHNLIKCVIEREKNIPIIGHKLDPQTAFLEKLESLKGLAQSENNAKRAVEWLASLDYSCITPSQCHGDLTFENLIVGNDGLIYVIDELDLFYSSWLLDVSKLLMDLDISWSWRTKGRMDVNFRVRKMLLRESIKELLSESEYRLCLNLEMFHILRIVPYVRNIPKVCEYLNFSLGEILKKVENI